jgi:radical SAM superfamily enzyme YgiQ (UPF0313 family)
MILINSSPKNALKIFQPFLPIYVPVGVGCLAAYLREKGIDVNVADQQIEDDVLDKISKYIQKMRKPYIFGFSVLTAAFKESIDLSLKLRAQYPDSIIVFGGIHSSAMPEEVLAYKHIDVVIRGEGERPLVEFYRCIKEGHDYSHINGLSYRNGETVVNNPISPQLEALDNYPHFPYEMFQSKKYDLGFVVSSRGCPYRCIFCSNRITTGRKYRYHSPARIVDDLELLHIKYGKKNVLFLDDNLLVSKERIYELIGEIKRRNLHKTMIFNFQARGDNVTPSLMKDLYEAGFRSVFFGIETASEQIMKTIKKDETVEQCVKAVRMAKEIGFHVSATFIYGLPGETHRDRKDALRLSKDLKLDMVRYNNATPYPGTELYEIAKNEERLFVQGLYENFSSVSSFIENPFREIPFSYVPSGNTEREIRNDILYSYLCFYFDFKKFKNIFTNPEKGVGWFNAGEKIADFLKKCPALFLLFFLMGIKFLKLFLSKLKALITRNK